MLFLEMKYHLFRNRARTLLLICAAAALCGCVAFFTHNVQANRQALDQLGKSSPATLRLTNSMMSTFDRLTIRAEDGDKLAELGLGDLKACSSAAGYWKQPYEGMSYGNDVELLAVTKLEAIGLSSAEGIECAPGVDGSFLEGDEPLCLVSWEFAEKNGISLGDTLSMQLCQKLLSSQSIDFFQIISEEKFELKAAGLLDRESQAGHAADLYLPSLWLRLQVEKTGLPFYYDSFSGSLTDSMKLNEFKAGLENLGYRQPYAMEPLSAEQALGIDWTSGTTAVMEDKTFIRSTEKLGASLQYYRILAAPLLLLTVGMAVLSVFLVLRGARRDMAISCSLGQPRIKIAAAHFLAVLAAQAAGCLLILPLLLLLGCSWGTILFAYGVFLACALFGNAVSLLILLRFEPMSLLTRAE